MDWITNPQIWIALVTLTVLEVVLGIDNVVFISILAAKLPTSKQKLARQVGLALAMVTRILLLLAISWITRLTAPIFAVFGHEVSGRDLILMIGGLFLIAKATHEIHNRLEGEQGHGDRAVRATFAAVVVQIMILDIVFSLDSVITAVGMVDQVEVMIAAIIIAVIVMMVSVEAISAFIERRPTLKMLALSFLLLIGVMLVAESFHTDIPKGYIYFAMGFSVFVEALNIRAGGRKAPQEPWKRFPGEETVG